MWMCPTSSQMKFLVCQALLLEPGCNQKIHREKKTFQPQILFAIVSPWMALGNCPSRRCNWHCENIHTDKSPRTSFSHGLSLIPTLNVTPCKWSQHPTIFSTPFVWGAQALDEISLASTKMTSPLPWLVSHAGLFVCYMSWDHHMSTQRNHGTAWISGWRLFSLVVCNKYRYWHILDLSQFPSWFSHVTM